METLRQSTPFARKTHTCDFCGLLIEKGAMYDRSTHIFDGTLYDWKAHSECTSIASRLQMFDYADEGITGDDFKESIQEAYREIMSEYFNEQYGSPTFEYPSFHNQLKFVQEWYSKPRPSGMKCPYCDHRSGEINAHFSHIEMFHTDKPFI